MIDCRPNIHPSPVESILVLAELRGTSSDRDTFEQRLRVVTYWLFTVEGTCSLALGQAR